MRRRLGLWLLSLGSAAATLAAIDLVLLLVHGPVRVVEDFYEPEPRYGYRMRPDLEFVFASPYHGYRATVRTNSRGLRDDEIAMPKPAGRRRILLLGDSMTAGLEVERDQTFEAVAEARLARDGRTEVLNAGVRGYNLDNIVAFLESEGLSYEPDVVVYFFTDNDLTAEPRFAPATGDVSRGFTLHGLRARFAAYSHLTYRGEMLRQKLLLRRARDRDTGRPERVSLPRGLLTFLTQPLSDAVPEYGSTARRIAALAELCRSRGAVFVLAGAPHREEIDPVVQRELQELLQRRLDFDAVRRYLDAVAAELGVARFDPIPEFRRSLPVERDFWWHRDNHLNARGHRLLGTLLADSLARDAAAR